MFTYTTGYAFVFPRRVLMNALRELHCVVSTPHAQIRPMHIHVNVNQDLLEMDSIAMVCNKH